MRHLHYVIYITVIVVVLSVAVFIKPNNITYTFTVNSYQFAGNEESTIDKSISDCNKFIPPVFKNEPIAPIEEIKRLNPSQTEEMDKLLMKYTKELIDYIDQIKKDLNDTYKKYELTCKK